MGMGAKRVRDAPNLNHDSAHYITQENGLMCFFKVLLSSNSTLVRLDQ